MDTNSRFKNRQEAGQLLADELMNLSERNDVVVLALPRGGVPVGYEVATKIHAPLDVFLVRKLAFPGHENLALGVVTGRGTRLMNDELLRLYQVDETEIARSEAVEREELIRLERLYRGDKPALDLKSKVVILIDDGLATGATMKAAVQALWQSEPERIIVALPVAALANIAPLEDEVDELVCLETPRDFNAISDWYEDFATVSDDDIADCISDAAYENARVTKSVS